MEIFILFYFDLCFRLKSNETIIDMHCIAVSRVQSYKMNVDGYR